MKASVHIALSIMVWVALYGCGHLTRHETVRFTGLEAAPKHFSGVLTLPKDTKTPVPVVVLVHGTAGVDSRYAFHRPALLEAGIGTLEVDFKTRVYTSPADRPPIATFQPWVFGALMALRTHPRVDAKRIAIMGFSLGGHLSVSAASTKVLTRWLAPGQQGFAAHVGLYPVCKLLQHQFDETGSTGAPILILSGDKDAWGDGQACKGFCDWLKQTHAGVVSLTMYPDAHHGFDRQGSMKGFAPFARKETAVLRWDAEAANDSRRRAVAFLRQAFDM